MDFDGLKLVVAIYNERNITAAAQSLYISQCVASRELAAIEKELDVKLFLRHKGLSNVAITPAGERFVQIANKALELKKEAMELHSFIQREHLHVAIIESVASFALNGFLRKFLQSNDESGSPLMITVSSHQSYEINSMIKKRMADVGVVNYVPFQAGVSSELLFQENYVLIRKRNELLDPEQPVHPTELRAENCIYYSFQVEFDQWHDYWWEPGLSKIELHSSGSSLEDMFLSPEDWTILPQSMAKAFPREEFCLSALIEPPPTRKCYLIKSSDIPRYNRESIERFCSQLRAFIDESGIGIKAE